MAREKVERFVSDLCSQKKTGRERPPTRRRVPTAPTVSLVVPCFPSPKIRALAATPHPPTAATLRRPARLPRTTPVRRPRTVSTAATTLAADKMTQVRGVGGVDRRAGRGVAAAHAALLLCPNAVVACCSPGEVHWGGDLLGEDFAISTYFVEVAGSLERERVQLEREAQSDVPTPPFLVPSLTPIPPTQPRPTPPWTASPSCPKPCPTCSASTAKRWW